MEVENFEEEDETEKKIENIKKEGELVLTSGNPCVEEIFAKIKIWKENKFDDSEECMLPEARSDLICILAVPSYVSGSDFISHCGSHIKNVENMKIMGDGSDNKYVVMIKFINQISADEFYKEFHKKRFNTMEPERCYLLFVASVHYSKTRNKIELDPDQKLRKSFDAAPSCNPFDLDLTEIPTCPVCLERMDNSVSGLVTILCNHTFHCDCLSQWRGDSSCPVCRHSQQPSNPEVVCDVCGTMESLWICVICGFVGCGRYVHHHARDHYAETMHTYALEIQTQRVWDYAGDGYVHRLIQNGSDGKLVELPDSNEPYDSRINSKDPETKTELIALEYNYLLTSQLDAQREYYESQFTKLEEEKAAMSLAQKKALLQASLAEKKFKKLQEKLQIHNKETKELQTIHEVLQKDTENWRATLAEKEKEQHLNTLKNKEIQNLQKENEDLQEQLKDLMFYIEASKTVQNHPEISQGQVVTVSPLKKKPRKRKRNKKKTVNLNEETPKTNVNLESGRNIQEDVNTVNQSSNVNPSNSEVEVK